MAPLLIGIIVILLTSGTLSRNYDNEEDDDKNNSEIVQISIIDRAFTNQRSFTCGLTSTLFVTASSTANLAPENIDTVAVMGDAFSTGIGLYQNTDIDFRGGGDANADGLFTLAHILSIFNPRLDGVSHGLGSVEALPRSQLNVARDGAVSDDMPEQALELINRIKALYTPPQLLKKWILVVITVGTEELCTKCREPNATALKKALWTLQRDLPRVFVVLVGPVHISNSPHRTFNLFRPLCKCLQHQKNEEMYPISRAWSKQFDALEKEFARLNLTTFSVLTISMLRVESHEPERLFIKGRPLFNRLGHAYAAKWLWNRLMTGPKYNKPRIPIPEDSYYCPSADCPFFRTPANYVKCMPMIINNNKILSAISPATASLHGVRALIVSHYVASTVGLIVLAMTIALVFGVCFYRRGRYAKKGRFDESQGV